MSIDCQSLPAGLQSTAQKLPDLPAIIFQNRRLTFAQINDLSDKIASNLVSQGIRKGDRVGLYCINSDAFVLSYFGILKAGATVVPVNLLYNPKEVAFNLRDAEAKAIIYYEAFAEVVAKLRAEIPQLNFGICIGEQRALETDPTLMELFANAGPVPDIKFEAKEDVAAILYTSGTSGRPKGAMLTHENLLSNTKSINKALPLKEGEDSVLLVLPMFHAFAATAGMLYPMLYGYTIVPLPRFEPRVVAEAIYEHKISMFMGVPSMYNVLLRLPPEYTEKFASLKYCISGGAAMPQSVMNAFEERFGKAIYEGDGPTECSPVTCINPVGGLRKPASVGKPVSNVEMKIMDENGCELPHGEIGEICVRGQNVMKGYWNLPDETKQAFFGEWFRTGDLGTEDEDGYFFIVDRKKDMLIVNGMNVYPRMIEEILYSYEPIAEAAVVGEPHKLHGEIPIAYVALREESQATEAEIRAFCREYLGNHEIPKRVVFRDALPKNAAGKILKRELSRSGELERGVDI